MECNLPGHLKEWFAAYCRGFYTENMADNHNIALKEKHTRLVCENMHLLSEGLALVDSDRETAQTIALFHDLGRFEQYRRYSTFRDDMSVNHAALGVKILKEGNVLKMLNEEERRTICLSVSLHNVFRLPASLNGRDLLFTQLIRDADKLDIWRIFAEFYGMPEAERASAAGLGFPDLPGCSPDVLRSLQQGEMVNLSLLKSLNDFKLLQLSWVFDLNFPVSFRLLQERGLICGLSATLPKEKEVENAVRDVRAFVANKAAKGVGNA
jgi:hypothetical protein